MTSAPSSDRTVLLTGATGFVGRAAFAGLEGAGWRVRSATRDAARAAARRAIEDERRSGPVAGAWGAVERLLASANGRNGQM